jgi:hypothetical protein
MAREYFRMECDCQVYEENTLYIDSCWELGVRHGFITDDFIIFKYCPWCGKKLEKVPIPKDMSLHEAQRCSYRLHMHMPLPNSTWGYYFDMGINEWKPIIDS